MRRSLMLLTLSLMASLAWAGSPKLATDLPDQGGVDRVDVIVQFTHPVTGDDLNGLRGVGTLKAELPLINAALVSVPAPALKGLANNPRIKFVSPDRGLSGAMDFTAAAVAADVAYSYGYDGSGVGVAIIDSGIYEHEELKNSSGTSSRVAYRQSFAGASTQDVLGHGTHVAGIIASRGAVLTTSTVRDEFNTESFSNNDGTASFSGPWQEIGETNGPTTGEIEVERDGGCSSRCLDVEADRYVGRGVMREVDLSGTSYATLSYVYSNDGSGGSVALEVSRDGGANWTTLRSYSLDTGMTNQVDTFDLTPYASSNTQIRFMVTSEVSGEMGIDDLQIEFGVDRDFSGIAPGASLIDLRVLDTDSKGTDSAVIAAIQAAVENKTKYNIRVINLSLGRGIFESYELDPLCQAVEAAWNAGIVVVVSAGNDGRNNSGNRHGYGTVSAPGNDPYVITVGAMNSLQTMGNGDDVIASYSSKGPSALDFVVKPDLVAPGNKIVSLQAPAGSVIASSPDNKVGTDYYLMSGSSMAAPVVSGAAALMLDKDPSLTPDQVKARLMKTASKNFPATSTWTDANTGAVYTSHYDIFTVGAGYLDVAAALNNTDASSGVALSPHAQYDAQTGTATLVHGNSVVWGDGLVWGDGFIFSDAIVWGDGLVWGDAMVWGDSVVWGDAIVWGDGLVWGDGFVFSDGLVWGEAFDQAMRGDE